MPASCERASKRIFSELVQCSPGSVSVNEFCVHCLCRLSLDSFLGEFGVSLGSFVVKIYTLCSPKGGHERLPKRMELQATYTWIQESELFYGFHYNLLRPRHGQAERHIEWSLERRGNEMNWTHIPRWRRGDWKNPRKGVLENQQNWAGNRALAGL